MNKKRKFMLVFLLLCIFISIKIINEYRERGLNTVIPYKPSDFYALGFTLDRNNVPDERIHEWITYDRIPANELMEFLQHYRVKKISEEEYTKYMNSRRFDFSISHNKANPAIVSVHESYVHVYVGNYYKVVNGPIDMEWIAAFSEKYSEDNTEE